MNTLLRLLKLIIDTVYQRPSVPGGPVEATPRKSAPVDAPVVSGDPSWFLEAMKYLGFHETGVNRGIEKFISLAGVGSLGDPWCAIFINAMLRAVGLPGSGSAMAQSFKSDPDFVRLSGPARGAIGVMWRGSRNSGSGHVFFYAGHDSRSRVIGLGGNQSDGVTYTAEDASRIIGYYWPKSVPLPTVGIVHIDGEYHVSSET